MIVLFITCLHVTTHWHVLLGIL